MRPLSRPISISSLVFVLLSAVIPACEGFEALDMLAIATRKVLKPLLSKESTRNPMAIDLKVSTKLAGWNEQCQGGHSIVNISCQPGLVCIQIFPYHRISTRDSFVGMCANLSDFSKGGPLASCKFNEKYRGGGCSDGYRCLPQGFLYGINSVPRTDTVGYCWPSNSSRGGKCRYGGRVEPIVCPRRLACVAQNLPEFPDSPFEGRCAKQGKLSRLSSSSKSSSASSSPPFNSTTSTRGFSSLTILSTLEAPSSTSNTPNNASHPRSLAPESPPLGSSRNSSLDYATPIGTSDFPAGTPSDYDSPPVPPGSNDSPPGPTSVDMSEGLDIPPVPFNGSCLIAGKFYVCQDGLLCQEYPDQHEVGQRWGICVKNP